jgi:hypothetical protein
VATKGQGLHPNSLKNLRKPWAAGECGNPNAKNSYGRTRAEVVAMYLETRSEKNPDKSRIEMVLDKVYSRALNGSDAAARLLVEQYGGRAQMRVQYSGTPDAGGPKREMTTAEVRAEIDAMLDEDDKRWDEGAQAVMDEPDPEAGPKN